MANAIVAELRSCLESDEVRACLDAAISADASLTYAILLPDESGSGFAPLLAGPRETAGELSGPLAAALEALWENETQQLELLPRGTSTAAGAAGPLRFRGERYGLLLVEGAGDLDLEWWQEIVDALGSELVKSQLYESANRESATRGSKLDALNEAGDLVRELDLEILLTKLMELAIRIMGADVGAVVLAEPDEPDGYRTGVEWGLREEVVLGFRTRDGRSLLDAVLDHGHPVLVEDATSSEWIDPDGLEVRLQSLLALPLAVQSKRMGVIVIVNSSAGGLRVEDSDVLATVANLSSTAIENALLYRAALEQERISAEMAMATDIQQRFLPKEAPRIPGYDLSGWSVPCSETGGDYFDFMDLGEGRTGIVVADATGHGMGAALVMFIVRASFRALLTRTHDLCEVLRAANDLLEADVEDGKFMTFFFGVLDAGARKITWASAGHDPAIIYRLETDEFLELRSTGIPLGVLSGVDFEEKEMELRPGDTVIMGTDGIWEARNRSGEFYGRDRLRALMRETGGDPLPAVADRLHEEILAYHDGAKQRDDITAAFLRVE